jgi:hypothetical protein
MLIRCYKEAIMTVKDVRLVNGKLRVTTDIESKEYDIANYLQATDVPDLTISSLSLLTSLAQVVMVLVKTLVEQEQLDETLVSGFDLQYVFETLVDELSAEEV